MARKKNKYPKMIRYCEKCGALQKPDEKKSNENWEVFDCNVKCECGGKFVTRYEIEE